MYRTTCILFLVALSLLWHWQCV